MIRIGEVLVHHLPAGPPLSARLSARLRRLAWRLRAPLPAVPALRLPARRILLGLAFFVVLTAVVLAVPVVSGAGDESTPVALDSSSTSSPGSAPRPEPDEPVVVMGVDGRGGSSSTSASRADRPEASTGTTAGTSRTSETSSTAELPTAEAPETTSGSSSAPGTTTATSGTTGRTTPPAGSASSTPSSPATSRPPATPPGPVAPADLGAQVVALVAQARAEAGCAASEADPTLADVGREHSAGMRDQRAISALDLAAWAVRGAAVSGGGTDADAVVAGWLADPATRAALLDCASSALGAGAAGGPGGPWITLVLA